MKALSIRQPWAYLIVSGRKDIENRSWRTHFRGKFLVHAGKKLDQEAYDSLIEAGVDLPPVQKLKFGGIIGEAEIVDCVTESHSKWFQGPFGFKLAKQKVKRFQPCRGKLSFFECP